jgi:hypothetical protein
MLMQMFTVLPALHIRDVNSFKSDIKKSSGWRRY